MVEIRIRIGTDPDDLILYTKFNQQKALISKFFEIDKRRANKVWVDYAEVALEYLLPLYLKYLKNSDSRITFDEFIRKLENEAQLQKTTLLLAQRDRVKSVIKY